MAESAPLLFSPLAIKSVTLANRIVIPPMAQYSAVEGMANDWHFANLSKFAMGGAGLVIVEATAVERQGRITNGCLGLWNDAQVAAFKPMVAFLASQGAVPGIQIGHAGRKAGIQRPWHGNGPLSEADVARGDQRWGALGPSARPLAEGWQVPKAMDADDLERTRDAFAAAAGRARQAGFEVLEIHMAHGYLLQAFLSPLANARNDAYGGDRAGRMRFPLEVAAAVRAAWPDDKPLFCRISAVDGIDGGWDMDDSVALARALKERGVDVIDCSSGGNSVKGATNSSLGRGPGFQVPFAARIRREADIMTQAVGYIRTAALAEQVLADGACDLVAIGREALYNPFWPRHAARQLGVDADFEAWPEQYGWWLEKWDKGIRRHQDEPAAGS